MTQLLTTTKEMTSSKVLKSILEELRLLREEIKLLLPQEDLEGYTNSKEIKQAYQKAIKKHPPVYGNS